MSDTPENRSRYVQGFKRGLRRGRYALPLALLAGPIGWGVEWYLYGTHTVESGLLLFALVFPLVYLGVVLSGVSE